MTSTTDATVDVARGSLTLVTISEDYREWPGTAPEDRTFYATAPDFDPETYVTVIVPETDDRHRGMWALSAPVYGLELDGPHRGWDVPRNMVRPYAATPADTGPFAAGDRIVQTGPHYIANGRTDHEYHESPNGIGSTGVVTYLETTYGPGMAVGVSWDGGLGSVIATDSISHVDDTRPRPASADLSESDRRALPISQAYPVGSVWLHRSYADPVTIVTHPTPTTVHITGPGVGDTDNRNWHRGALDAHGTFVKWADDAPAPAVETTPETFTSGGDVDSTTVAGAEERTYSREDVDRMVEEAREAAKREADAALEAFKREANRIAVQYAEDNGLCSQFERAMDDIGLLGRDEWHDQHDETYRVTFTVSLEVTGRDEEDAEDKARSDLFESLEYPVDRTIQHHSTEVL